MNEDLIKELRENAEWADSNIYEVPIMLPDTLRAAADALEDMNNQWISVKDRLPEDDKSLKRLSNDNLDLVSVLACGYICEESEATISVVIRSCVKKCGIPDMDGQFKEYEKWRWPTYFTTVTHWMPLPEPPKEENK